jgi:hypothetical protein
LVTIGGRPVTAPTPPRPPRNILGRGLATVLSPQIPTISQVAKLGHRPAREEASERTKRNALVTAMRAIAVGSDSQATYDRRLNDFQLGYLAGHARALRRARGPT